MQSSPVREIEFSPLGTADQRELEALAMRLLASPEMAEQRAKSRELFLADPVARSEEGMATLDAALDELCCVHAMGAANSDPARPKVMWYFTAAREWMGQRVAGGRWGFDNPDNVYRFVTVDGQSSYRFTVRPNEPDAVYFSFMLFDSYAGDNTKQRSIWLDQPISALLDQHVQREADGSIIITLDNKPANGRKNHLQSNDDARIFMIRHTLTDWASQHVPFVDVERLDGPPAPAPESERELARRAAYLLAAATDFILRLNYNAFTVMPPNVLTKPWIRGGGHGMSANGRFVLGDDEVLLVTLDPLGAKYLGFGIADPWTVSFEHIHGNGSLNNSQAQANADGSYTYVISPRDPGVHNWLDTGGLKTGAMMQRWQGLPPGTVDTERGVRAVKIVKFDELRERLPAETVWLSPEQRAEQYRQRAVEYARRYEAIK